MNIILLSYLLINAWTDWKKREIHIVHTIIFIVIGVMYKLMVQDAYDWKGLIPGMILLIISFLWKNHIGAGDGIVVMFLGWMCGLTQVCNVVSVGFLLAASVGVICCIKEKRMDIDMPFVPFILGSYMLKLWI